MSDRPRIRARLASVPLLLLVGVGTGPIASAADAPRMTPQEAIASVDWNKDGLVDRREFFDAMMYDHFMLDTNRDGQLSFEEVRPLEVKRKAFDEADTNGDGGISSNEYINARFEDFEVADENHDGLLSLPEVRKFEERLY